MQRVKTVKIGEHTVNVRELTVGDVRVWLEDILQAQDLNNVDVIGEGLFQDCSLADLARMSDLKLADMDALAPSELKAVIDAAREVNGYFFALRAGLVAAGEKIRAARPSATPAS